MPLTGFSKYLEAETSALEAAGTAKGPEAVVTRALPPAGPISVKLKVILSSSTWKPIAGRPKFTVQ